MNSRALPALSVWFMLALSAVSVTAEESAQRETAAVSEAVPDTDSSTDPSADSGTADPMTASVAELPAAVAGQVPVAGQSSASAFAGHDLSPWGMYQAADVVVKAVMIGLLLASLLTWTIWLFKTVQLWLARRKARHLLQQLHQCKTFADAETALKQQASNELALVRACQHELDLSGDHIGNGSGLKERLSASLERVQAALTRHMNLGTGILATIGSVAPFVGLFGTVWGIMNSFIGIAETKTTNLAVVAPGIAEALLATAIGLVAAIPAVVIYNHFSRVIGQYRAQLTDIATALLVIISRDLDRQSATRHERKEAA